VRVNYSFLNDVHLNPI